MNLSVLSGDTEYIARISHGKDSRKMLDVIASRGLPLDRITTTDIWATDTIRGEHPKMVEFGYRMDENIWREYHIEVEHLCAMRNGEKVTYEKMFYHVPKRRIKNAGGGGLTTARNVPRLPNPVGAVVPVRSQSTRDCRRASLYKEGHGAKSSSIYGFPVSINRKGQWCQKLKTRFLDGPATGGGKNIVEYLGIAADEPERLARLDGISKVSPLAAVGWTEADCWKWCEENDLLSPIYTTSTRGGVLVLPQSKHRATTPVAPQLPGSMGAAA